MQVPNIIAFCTRLRFAFGLTLAFGIFGGQLAAYAADDADSYEVSQEQDQDGDQEETVLRKAPEATQGSATNILPDLDRPTWEVSLPQSTVDYPVYKATPLQEQHFFRTLFRQIISPNAP